MNSTRPHIVPISEHGKFDKKHSKHGGRAVLDHWLLWQGEISTFAAAQDCLQIGEDEVDVNFFNRRKGLSSIGLDCFEKGTLLNVKHVASNHFHKHRDTTVDAE